MPKKILVVEDEPDIVSAVKARLEATGYSVEAALDGEDAVEKFGEFKPDMVLLDIRIPKMDGREVCKVIRSKPEGRNVPIVILTALDSWDMEKTCYTLGADGFIAKPFETNEFLAKIRSFLGE